MAETKFILKLIIIYRYDIIIMCYQLSYSTKNVKIEGKQIHYTKYTFNKNEVLVAV